ncbi:MAG: TonB-dependent receptor, partial [Cystobacterineae bacterium]|nr:TonB-dependent receptor [Cystobacterineae bacterium]
PPPPPQEETPGAETKETTGAPPEKDNTKPPPPPQEETSGAETKATTEATALEEETLPAAEEEAGAEEEAQAVGEPILSSTVSGRSLPKAKGGGDFQIEVGALAVVPRNSAAQLLNMAPGILLTNEGGALHAESIFLRGFDAREGQDIELSIGGFPINQAGNLHGNGYADLHFIIPELVDSLRVLEGPFEARQGNFAVAGSAEYRLGLRQKGLTLKGSLGSHGLRRLLATWRPNAGDGQTFVGAQIYQTAGFGQNRDARSAAAMAQTLFPLSDTLSLRLFSFAYFGNYHSAGVLREDDVGEGRKSFFDSYDLGQGGDSTQVGLLASLAGREGGVRHEQRVFFGFRNMRLRENFTGFVFDTQLAQQTPHAQRGDMLDKSSQSFMAGAGGYGRMKTQLWEIPLEWELGYFARLDVVASQQARLFAGTDIPYHTDEDLDSVLGDMGLYADVEVKPWQFLSLQGSLRWELLAYSLTDKCFIKEVRRPSSSNPPLDESCLNQRDFGVYRERFQKLSTVGSAFIPKAAVVLGPFWDFKLTGAYGLGFRSVDPQYIGQDLKTPFASLSAWEVGALYNRQWGEVALEGRGVVFGTHVDKDLVFSEQAGRNILGGGTTRLGTLLAGRLLGRFFDVSANATWVQSTFDDTGLLVPYVPDFVGRLDGALFGALPWTLGGKPLMARLGLGINWVGRRPLPYGQRSGSIFVVDANTEWQWRNFTLGFAVTNLFNRRYRLAEFNYVSNFQTGNLSPPPLAPARHFVAGAPLAFWFSLAVNLGGEG